MGVHQLKEALSDVPGIGELTMRYEDGGMVQVFCIGKTQARVGARASNDEIRKALLDSIQDG